MRSSKSRSRSKTNRPRTLGNIINRVFDSSGPEGKVRGTPQQIIEKYVFLARDAQLSNDRVAAENFLQHAEHYTRMLGEANRELAAEQDSRQPYQPQNGGHQNGGQQNGGQQNAAQQNGGRDRDAQRVDPRQDARSDPRQDQRSDNRADPRPEARSDNRPDNRPDNRDQNRSEPRSDPRQDRERAETRADARAETRSELRPDPRSEERPADRGDFRGDFRPDFTSHRLAETRSAPDDVIDLSGDDDRGLVETPEAAESSPRRTAQPRAAVPDEMPRSDEMMVPRDRPDLTSPAEGGGVIEAEGDVAAPKPASKPRSTSARRPRSAKKPAEPSETGIETPGGAPREAAE